MDIHKLLAEERNEKEETKYVPTNMPVSLHDRIMEIVEREGLSRSKVMVVAARLLVESYNSPQGAVEGGGGAGN